MPERIPYAPHLKELARQLRNNATIGEILLWKKLRAGNLSGFDFHRQKPILNYIVDFYSFNLKLVIEIDGSYHSFETMSEADLLRDEELNKIGLTVLRFTELQVRKDIKNVIRAIEMHAEGHTP